ncbi:unannotated protein [freshwater metagenome]|uniref:Unannotated protein n=1 Tax=freshwater metagenome TaxID=449393 RepID=A0A6J7U9X3_9ZZZZ
MISVAASAQQMKVIIAGLSGSSCRFSIRGTTTNSKKLAISMNLNKNLLPENANQQLLKQPKIGIRSRNLSSEKSLTNTDSCT